MAEDSFDKAKGKLTGGSGIGSGKDKIAANQEAKRKKAREEKRQEAAARGTLNPGEKQLGRKLAAAKKVSFMAEHTVAADETLSHLASKYYKHATKPYYMLIYEANKAVIGDNPNVIKVGMELKIPELPADMKD